MSHATFSLPHVFPSSSRSRHMNNPSGQQFQGYHSDSSSQPQSSHLASSASPGVQRSLPYLLAARGPLSSSSLPRKPSYSSLSSSSSFSTKSRGSSSRMVAPAAETQLQAGQVVGAAAASVMHRKSRATCTLSLAHVSASAFRPSVSTTSSGVATPAGSPSAASTADQVSNSGSDEGSSLVNEDKLDQAQAQALKDAVTNAPVHMCVGVDGPFPRIDVEVEASNSTMSSDERMVFSEPEDVMTTAKAIPIAIPSKLSVRTKKSQKSMAAKKRQSEVNIIPFPSSEASSSSFAEYMQERHSYNRERSGSISSSYSSTSSRSFSSSSSSGSSSSSTSVTSSASSPPHALLRTSPPLTLRPLPKRSRRGSNVSVESAPHVSPAALSIDTSAATTSSSTSAAALVDDRDPPSPSSPRSSSSSCTLIDSDEGSDSTPVSPVKSDLKAKSTLALTMETTPPPPPYSLLPPPYFPLHPYAKGSDAKEAHGSTQSRRPRRPLPEPPVRALASLPVTEVRAQEEVRPIPAEVDVIHAPVPRAAFVRIEGGDVVPNAEVGDKGLGGGSPLDGSAVSLPPISPPAQPPRVRTTSRTAVSGSSSSAKASTSRRSRISTGELKVLLFLYRTVVFGLESRYQLEGERSHSPSFMDQKAASPRFPLVEEDEDADQNMQTPHSSPSTSPSMPSHFPAARFDPSSCGCASSASNTGSCPSPSMQAFKEAKQRAKAKQAADNALDVQDALLAIRLRGLLRAQGVPEADLDLRINSQTQLGDGKDPHSTIVVEDDGGAEDLDPFAEFGAVELDSASESSDTGRTSVPARPFKASPPPLSRSSSSGKSVIAPSAAYMIALLTMRYRYASPSRRHRLTSGTMKNGAHAGGRRSKLNIAAWAASPDGVIVEQEEADFDSCSVVDWYI